MHVSSAVFHRSQHLTEKDLERPKPGCPFCESTDRRRISLLQDSPDIYICYCTRCHACSASRMPTDYALSAYYEQYYDAGAISSRIQRVTFDNHLRFGSHLARLYISEAVNHSDAGTISILDFGGGDGSISLEVAKELIRLGYHYVSIHLVDLNQTVVDSQSNQISLQRSASLPPSGVAYDFIIASAILEHLPYPVNDLKRLLDLLSPHGSLYVRTPYMIPLKRFLSVFRINLDLTYPAHIHDLGQDFWEKGFSELFGLNAYKVCVSRPSIVETSFKVHPFTTFAAYLMKSIWHVWKGWKLVGGWEVLIKKASAI